MLFNHAIGSFRFPLYQVDGGGSGGGSGAGAGGGQGSSGTGAGAGSGQQQQSTSQGGNQNIGGGTSTTPTVHDYDENMLVKFKGSDKPVKLGDHVRGFQSQFTKASQEAAKLKKDFASQQQELQRIREAAGGRNGDPNANAGADMLASIESQPFIDGKMMGSVLKDLQGGMRERDMVQLAVLNKIKTIEGILNELHGTSINSSHQSKLKKWLGDGGYDADDQNTYELADIIYRGYEGENLDEEFPAIFESRWKQMQAAVQRRADRERQRTRNLPFTPGKGGNGAPGKAQGLTGKESPKELADFFFNRFGGGSDT